MNLWNLARHQRAVVESFPKTLDLKYMQRLKDLGITEGEEILCLRKSILGGPRVYQVGGQLLALEKTLALSIQVKLL